MTDITMCSGVRCKAKKTCYRYKAPKGQWQSMFQCPPGKDEKCPHYWKTEDSIKKEKK